jgi:uncharacterized protein (DUF305 family)
MKKQLIFAIIILVVAGVVAVAFMSWKGGFSGHDMHRMPDGSLMSDGEAMQMDVMNHAAMMVTSEQGFLEGMIPHHQEAVDTAKEVIARGGSTAEIKKLAEDIIVAQEAEIASMKGWYEVWYGIPYTANNFYKPMMRDLSGLEGSALDRAFLEDMVMHHMGAIMMAQSVGAYIEHGEIRTLAETIVRTQSNEITYMRQLLEGLK